MLKKIYMFWALLLLVSLPAFAIQTNYSGIIEDLPLMPGMVEKSAEAVIFDKPGGRIVETEAEAQSSREDISRFYAATLPPLGWKVLSPSEFIRDNEKLKLDFEKEHETTTVHFTLTPENEGK